MSLASDSLLLMINASPRSFARPMTRDPQRLHATTPSKAVRLGSSTQKKSRSKWIINTKPVCLTLSSSHSSRALCTSVSRATLSVYIRVITASTENRSCCYQTRAESRGGKKSRRMEFVVEFFSLLLKSIR